MDGLLDTVRLYLIGDGTSSTWVTFCNATSTECFGGSLSVVPGTEYGWVTFAFPNPAPVIKGTKYALHISMAGFSTRDAGFSSTDTYAGGEAIEYQNGSWVSPPMAGVADFMFQTFVDPQTTALDWNRTQITAGQSTSLQLTETYVYPSWFGEQPDAVPAGAARPALNAPGATWTVKANALPSWFTPSGIACSSQIASGDCLLANATGSGSMPATPDGDPITITLTGSVTPAAGDVGTSTAKADGCVAYTIYSNTYTDCVTGSAGIEVLAAEANPTPTPATTLPPTSSQAPSRPGESSAALALVLLALAAMGSIAALSIRRRE